MDKFITSPERIMLENDFNILEKRIKIIENLESIKHPTHLKELIIDLMDRLDELEEKVHNWNDL